MTNPNADLRRTRVNRLKRGGRCAHCGGPVSLWFAVETCTPCLVSVTYGLEDVRLQRPTPLHAPKTGYEIGWKS